MSLLSCWQGIGLPVWGQSDLKLACLLADTSQGVTNILIFWQVCSACRGQLQALGRFNADGTQAKVRAPSQYSLFVKDSFASQKEKCGPGIPHKEIMQALSASWKACAASCAADDASALV